MFRKYTSDQNIVMCWRMLNSRAYRMAGASDCMGRGVRLHVRAPHERAMLVLQAHSLAICPGAFMKIPGILLSRDLPEATVRS